MPSHIDEPLQFDSLDLAIRRKSEILYGSIKVIARDGVVAAKLKDIARESGVSLGLIQHYFDTRDNLVHEAFSVMMRVISNVSASRLQSIDDPLHYIYAINRQHTFGTVAFPERWGFWSELWAAAGRSTRLRGVATQVYQMWAEPLEARLQQLLEEGRLPENSDPRRTTAGILALMDGLSVRTLAEPDVFTPNFILDVLNDWVTTQLGVNRDEAQKIIASLAEDDTTNTPPALTPEIVAIALIENASVEAL